MPHNASGVINELKLVLGQLTKIIIKRTNIDKKRLNNAITFGSMKPFFGIDCAEWLFFIMLYRTKLSSNDPRHYQPGLN